MNKQEIFWNGYTIIRWVVAVVDDSIFGEFDSISAAKKAMKGVSCIFKYAAAEVINDDGDVNPAVYGDSISDVMSKLKAVL